MRMRSPLPIGVPALLRRGTIGLLMFFVGASHAALFARTAANLHSEAQAAKAEGKQLAVALTLPDCPGCLEMAKIVYADRATELAIGRRFRTVRLDISGTGIVIDALGRSTTAADLAKRLRVVATPSFVFFGGDGRILYRYTGPLDRAGLRSLADYVTHEKFEQFPFVAGAD
jgi:thioredoxin-related protein